MIDNNIKTYSTNSTNGIIVRKPIGSWVINGEILFTIHVEAMRPNWFHQIMTRLLLGWKWEDEK